MSFATYYEDHLTAIRDLAGDAPVVRYFEATNPDPPAIATWGQVQRVSSRRIILRHPQTDYVIWTDRRGHAFTMKSAGDVANGLILTLQRQDVAAVGQTVEREKRAVA